MLTYSAFVIYGSLVPFDFHPLSLEKAWVLFQQTPFLQLGVESRADWVANGVLYAPLGFLGVRAFGGGHRPLSSALLALAYVSSLAFAVEFAQLFFPPRTVSQNDLLAECLGATVGVAASFWLGPWLAHWWHAWEKDPARLSRLAWQGYVVGYLLFCFFPFDFLLSRQEFLTKLASGNHAWLFALPETSFTSWLRAIMLLLIEAALTIPIGLAMVRGNTAKTIFFRGFAAGSIIGLLIEIGQLFIASGVSQGASLFSRALGVGLGAWLSTRWTRNYIEQWRNWISNHLHWLAPVYLGVLAFAAGWGSHPWIGWNRAWISWTELRFLPFYYHYFTTEAAALVSLGSIFVMYGPLAILVWSRSVRAGVAAVMAMVLAGFVEAGKLFMAEIHPDPTNILLAGVSVCLIVQALKYWERWHARVILATNESIDQNLAPPSDVELGEPAADMQGVAIKQSDRLWLGALLLAVLWASIGWPAYPVLVVGVLAAAVAATWWRPAAALAILPAAMPIFDLAPWSGRFYLDEFDLLCASCFGVAFMRERPPLFGKHLSGLTLVFMAMILCLTLAALRTCCAFSSLDMNSFASYHSPFNGLRILKGALWAWLFVALYRSLASKQPALARLFHAGQATGLLLTVAVVLWERMATVGMFDFSTEYRVTGPFSTMNKGGAYIECFLAVASAFVIVELASCRGRLKFWLGAVLLVLAGYATLVTYSRNGYAALAFALAVGIASAIATWRTLRHNYSMALPALFAMTLVLVAGGMALSGGYAHERLKASERDMGVRIAHWRAALDLRDDDIATSLLGVGLGRFPELHFWRSIQEQRAASFRLDAGNGNPFLRLAPGAPIYIEQIISPPAGEELELSINLRSNTATPPKLAVTLCRKTLLTSDECEQVEVKGIVARGFWQNQYATFPPLPDPASPLASTLPVKVSLVTPNDGPAVDVDNVTIRLPGKDQYFTRNGSFAKGMDNWFFATDVDPPWHIHNMPVALLFDLGWLGLAAALVLTVIAIVGGQRALRQGRVEGTAAFAGLLAFLASGSLNTLIDEPRFLWLWLVLTWICAWQGKRRKLQIETNVSA